MTIMSVCYARPLLDRKDILDFDIEGVKPKTSVTIKMVNNVKIKFSEIKQKVESNGLILGSNSEISYDTQTSPRRELTLQMTPEEFYFLLSVKSFTIKNFEMIELVGRVGQSNDIFEKFQIVRKDFVSNMCVSLTEKQNSAKTTDKPNES